MRLLFIPIFRVIAQGMRRVASTELLRRLGVMGYPAGMMGAQPQDGQAAYTNALNPNPLGLLFKLSTAQLILFTL